MRYCFRAIHAVIISIWLKSTGINILKRNIAQKYVLSARDQPQEIALHTPTFSNSVSAYRSDSCLHWPENMTLNCFDAKVQDNTNILIPVKTTYNYFSQGHIRAHLPKNDFVSLRDILEDFWQDVLYDL